MFSAKKRKLLLALSSKFFIATTTAMIIIRSATPQNLTFKTSQAFSSKMKGKKRNIFIRISSSSSSSNQAILSTFDSFQSKNQKKNYIAKKELLNNTILVVVSSFVFLPLANFSIQNSCPHSSIYKRRKKMMIDAVQSRIFFFVFE